MSLREEVTKESIFYIHSIVYDSSCHTLKINFLKSSEDQNKTKRTLTFLSIDCFSEKLDLENFDENCLDSLISLEEILQEKGFKYLILTEQHEMTFFSKTKPQIRDLEAE